jgi:D-tyrosyl-tRNA(Tyr) deacylase
MKLVVQRTGSAEVWIEGERLNSTGKGLLVLFGTKRGDRVESCGQLADKVVNLRIFEDAAGKMNLSALEIDAEIMIVSQFTLYADCRKGRRPGFNDAMEPAEAEALYHKFVELVGASGLVTRTGEFGASMEVKLTNQGPVTIILEHDA